MARRAAEPAERGPRLPSRLVRFVEADWTDAGDDEDPMVQDWGLLRTRQILARGRWSTARRAYVDAHGITLRDLPRASRVVSSEDG